MAIRQVRLTAGLLLAAIAAVALLALLQFGPHHAVAFRSGGREVPVWQLSFIFPAHALIWTLIFSGAARVRRWRRNIVRAGAAFGSAWTGVLALILAVELLTFASAAGYVFDYGKALTIVIAVLLLFRANLLPKSRPGWFSGTVLPHFAPDPMQWRKVHRASAARLLAIALAASWIALFGPSGIDPLRTLMLLMCLEVLAANLHALWLRARMPY